MRVSFSLERPSRPNARPGGILRPRTSPLAGGSARASGTVDFEALASELAQEICGRIGNGVRRRRHLQVPEPRAQ